MNGRDSLRVQPSLETPTRRGDARRCSAAGCLRSTREGKPYCSDHVSLHAYVMQVQQRLQQRAKMETRASEGKRVSAYDEIAEDILSHLRHRGRLSPERIARELNMDPRAVRKYVSALCRSQRATRHIGARRVFVEALEDTSAKAIA